MDHCLGALGPLRNKPTVRAETLLKGAASVTFKPGDTVWVQAGRWKDESKEGGWRGEVISDAGPKVDFLCEDGKRYTGIWKRKVCRYEVHDGSSREYVDLHDNSSPIAFDPYYCIRCAMTASSDWRLLWDGSQVCVALGLLFLDLTPTLTLTRPKP